MLENLSKELQEKVLLKKLEKTSTKYDITIYENNYYKIRKFYNKDLNYSTHDCESKEKYIPQIYIKDNLDGEGIDSIDIQTTAYGSMQVEEIEKVIEGYQVAVLTVKQLKEIFNLK